jgi:hypothetical protein
VISFLQPWVLAALPLAGVPLLLHLIARREPPTVVFPAVRYLQAVTREHERRLKLRHWLLLLLRTLLILALIIAAAGPSAALRQAGGHGPSALVLVLDNSPSAGQVVNGTSRLTDLRAAARRILDGATPADGLWLLTADGIPQRGTAAELSRVVDSLAASDRRMDLGEAVASATQVLGADTRPGGIAVLSDLQATALSPAEVNTPLLVVRMEGESPPNIGVASLSAGSQPWTIEGASVVVTLAGDSGRSAPVTVSLGGRTGRAALALVGTPSSIAVPGGASGWWTLRAFVDPDEFRADDERLAAVRVAPIAAVSWPAGDQYLQAAEAVLEANGRARKGPEVTIGSLGPSASIVLPPADPAQLGAVNRALERRGTGWVYDVIVPAPGVVDSGPLLGNERVLKRYRLRATKNSSSAGVLATVGGEPWIVRGADVVMIGSRMDPEWTSLPLSAAFMPFLDAMINRVARGQIASLAAAPGDPVALPDQATGLIANGRKWTIEGGAAFRPPEVGLYYLLGGRDTIGVLTANLDPRESELVPASDAEVRSLWSGARIVEPGHAAAEAFAQVGRADLQAPLLWLAFALAVTEVVLASGWRRRS